MKKIVEITARIAVEVDESVETARLFLHNVDKAEARDPKGNSYPVISWKTEAVEDRNIRLADEIRA